MRAGDIDCFDVLLCDATCNAETEWDETFCASINTKYNEWGNEMLVSEKQLAQLERLAGE